MENIWEFSQPVIPTVFTTFLVTLVLVYLLVRVRLSTTEKPLSEECQAMIRIIRSPDVIVRESVVVYQTREGDLTCYKEMYQPRIKGEGIDVCYSFPRAELKAIWKEVQWRIDDECDRKRKNVLLIPSEPAKS